MNHTDKLRANHRLSPETNRMQDAGVELQQLSVRITRNNQDALNWTNKSNSPNAKPNCEMCGEGTSISLLCVSSARPRLVTSTTRLYAPQLMEGIALFLRDPLMCLLKDSNQTGDTQVYGEYLELRLINHTGGLRTKHGQSRETGISPGPICLPFKKTSAATVRCAIS